MSDHPSFLALDRAAFMAASEVAGEVAAHLERCAECARYVDDARAAREIALPSRALAPAPTRSIPRWRTSWLAIPLVATMALVVYLRPSSTRNDGIRDKGGPAVAAYVKRDEHVFAWDRKSAVHPGDHIRLEVVGAELRQVSVAALDEQGRLARVLYAGALAGRGPELLPVSWRVDADGGHEVLSVALGRAAISEAAHRRILDGDRSEGVWETRLVFDKQVSR